MTHGNMNVKRVIFIIYRPWGPPSLLYNGYRLTFPGVKRPVRGVDHSPPPSVGVKQVPLYSCSPTGPSWPVIG
jgi:hypothetical protein